MAKLVKAENILRPWQRKLACQADRIAKAMPMEVTGWGNGLIGVLFLDTWKP